MNIEVRATLDEHAVLLAVRKLCANFRTNYDLPIIQLHTIREVQRALKKVELQVKWWPQTHKFSVSSDAFEFLANCLIDDGRIKRDAFCTACEKQWVKELAAAGVIKKDDGGYVEKQL